VKVETPQYKPLDPDPGRTRRRAGIVLAFLVIATALVIIFGGQPRKAKPSVTASKSVKIDFSLKNLNDSTVSLSSLQGKLVLISFWSSTCPASLLAVPELKLLYSKYRDREVAFLAVALGDRRDSLEKFVKATEIDYPVLLGTDSVARTFGVNLLPTYVVINRTGGTDYRVEGYDADSGLVALERALNHLAAKKPGRG
jgi:thiol-disulfide isomerase/thioredoxin